MPNKNKNKIVIFSAIDNLIKGAAGQAVQNMNYLYKFKEYFRFKMRYILISLFFLTLSCNKQKSVLICGDHKCINKAEAKQYFEDNLTIEVQIISKNKTSSYDLVDINQRR